MTAEKQTEENSTLEVPTRSPGDAAHALAKAGLAGLPLVGGPAAVVFSALLLPPIERRRDAWMNEVGEALLRLEEGRHVKLEDLAQDECFLDIVMQATQTALRTSLEEKRQALRNAILNAALQFPPEEVKREMFLSIIDDMTVWHIRMLKFLQDPHGWMGIQGRSLELDEKSCWGFLFPQAFPELCKMPGPGYLESVWEDLGRRGLTVGHETSMFAKFDSKGGLRELGKDFLRFIEAPLEE